MAGPVSNYEDEIRSSLSPSNSDKGAKSYIEELAAVLGAPNADMGPHGIAGGLLRQLIGPQNALANPEKYGEAPRYIPGMPYYPPMHGASDIPNSKKYSPEFNIPSKENDLGREGVQSIMEQLVGRIGGGRT